MWTVRVGWNHWFHLKQTMIVQAYLVTIDWYFRNIVFDIVVAVELVLIVIVSLLIS